MAHEATKTRSMAFAMSWHPRQLLTPLVASWNEQTGLGAHDHGEHIFIQMHLVLLLVKFTVLYRQYHRFHPDAEPSQMSISAYSLSASINRYKQGYSFFAKGDDLC